MAASPVVSTAWLEEHLDDPNVRVIEVSDVNDMALYHSGHIPGATWFYWKDISWHETDRQFITPEAMAKRLGDIGIGPNTTVVLYGNPVQYGTYVFWMLTMAGHADLRVLDGTRTKWVAENRPLSTETPHVEPVAYLAPAPGNASMRLGREAVRERLGVPGCLILDGRTPEEYAGLTVGGMGNDTGPGHGAQRFGRIPGAVHLFFKKFLNKDDTFKTVDELRDILNSVGATQNDVNEIVCYCRLSHRATLLWTVMTFICGLKNVKIYDGSWTEWGSIVGFPIEN